MIDPLVVKDSFFRIRVAHFPTPKVAKRDPPGLSETWTAGLVVVPDLREDQDLRRLVASTKAKGRRVEAGRKKKTWGELLIWVLQI